MKYFLLALSVSGAMLVSACGGIVATSGQITFTDDGVRAGIVFTDADRRVIVSYYADRHPGKGRGKTPPGLAKRRGALPPGLAKRDVLPRGLQGRGLPGTLEARLTVLPAPYVRLVIGSDVVILDRHTRVVMDILRGVIP